MEGKQMIEILIGGIHSYCQSLIGVCMSDCDNCQCVEKIINTKRCQAEELLNEYDYEPLKLFFNGIVKGIIVNNAFPNYEIRIDDINGKTIKYLWNQYHNKNGILNYEPFTICKRFIKSLDEDGIINKQVDDEIVISPMYVFEAMKQFSVFDENVNELPKKMGRSYKEYALAYIFDLYAKGSCVPMNLSEGGLAKKELEKIGENKEITPDSFYRAVKEIIIDKKYDLNKIRDLEAISRDWYNAVVLLSDNSENMKEYLSKKGLQ